MTPMLDENSPKAKRIIKSFEPTPANARMLERADRDGIKLTHICNRAIYEWLTRRGYARKKDAESNGKPARTEGGK